VISRATARQGGPPYDVAQAAEMCLPLTFVEIEHLTPGRINRWLEERRVTYHLDVDERGLHGCLVAHRAAGLAFIDAADPAPERRYTVAHEVAHFLLDYWLVRQRAIEEFGPTIQSVLDGHRALRLEERLDSIFLRTPLVPYVCLLDRGSASGRTDVWASENRADQLAVQLLAPYPEVCRAVCADGAPAGYFQCRTRARHVLIDPFGLPEEIARTYARLVADRITGGISVAESWGL
jgi:hypothetical protein